MKITKAHIQVAILIIGGLVAVGTWVSPTLFKHSTASSTPVQASVPAKQGDDMAPHQKTVKKPAPKASERQPLAINAQTQALIDGSANLAVEKINASIAVEKSRTRKAKQAGKKETPTASELNSALGLMDTPQTVSTPSNVKPDAPKPTIDRMSLRGLSVKGNQASAYLALDGGQPFLVRAGQTISGVRVTNINANGVRLTQGSHVRVLEGGL